MGYGSVNVSSVLSDDALPWCSGDFNDTSIAVNTWKMLTPNPTGGDSSMVNGNTFAAKNSGLHMLVCSEGAVSSSGNQYTGISLNTVMTASGVGRVSSSVLNSAQGLPFVVGLAYLNKGDYLMQGLYSNVANTSIRYGGYSRIFMFAQLTRE